MPSMERQIMDEMRNGVQSNPKQAAQALLELAYENSSTNSLASVVASLSKTVDDLSETTKTIHESLTKALDSLRETQNQADSNKQNVDILIKEVRDLHEQNKKAQEDQFIKMEKALEEAKKPSPYKTHAVKVLIGALIIGFVAQTLIIFGIGS